MAVAFGSQGAYDYDGITTLLLPYPSGIAAGNILVVCIANKYPTNGPSTPSGWTAPSNNQGSGGAGGSGAGSGTLYATIFVKEATGSESGSLSVSLPSANCAIGIMLRYTKSASAVWSYACAQGTDNTAGTSYSATGNADPGIRASDMIITATGFNNTYSMSGEVLAATGLTIGTTTERMDYRTFDGDDARLIVTDFTISAGTSSSAPTLTGTASGSDANSPAGPTVFLRIREVLDETLTITAASDMTASAAIDVTQSHSVASNMAQTGLLTMTAELTVTAAADCTFAETLTSTYTETLDFDVDATAGMEPDRFWEEALTESVASDLTTDHTLDQTQTLTLDAPGTNDYESFIDTFDTDAYLSVSNLALVSTIDMAESTDEQAIAGITFEVSQVISDSLTFSAVADFPLTPNDDILVPPILDERSWITYTPDLVPLTEDARNWLVYRPLRVIIPTELESMPTISLLEVKDPLEVLLVQFRYDNLATGETISSATVTATVHTGTDATPSAIISGAATISGTTVTQKIIGGLTTVTYKLRCSAVTSATRTLVIPALLPVETF